MKSASEFKAEKWEYNDYIVTGFGNNHPSVFTKREADTIVMFLKHITPLIQRNALDSAIAVLNATEVEGGECCYASTRKVESAIKN